MVLGLGLRALRIEGQLWTTVPEKSGHPNPQANAVQPKLEALKPTVRASKCRFQRVRGPHVNPVYCLPLNEGPIISDSAETPTLAPAGDGKLEPRLLPLGPVRFSSYPCSNRGNCTCRYDLRKVFCKYTASHGMWGILLSTLAEEDLSNSCRRTSW